MNENCGRNVQNNINLRHNIKVYTWLQLPDEAC